MIKELLDFTYLLSELVEWPLHFWCALPKYDGPRTIFKILFYFYTAIAISTLHLCTWMKLRLCTSAPFIFTMASPGWRPLHWCWSHTLFTTTVLPPVPPAIKLNPKLPSCLHFARAIGTSSLPPPLLNTPGDGMLRLGLPLLALLKVKNGPSECMLVGGVSRERWPFWKCEHCLPTTGEEEMEAWLGSVWGRGKRESGGLGA